MQRVIVYACEGDEEQFDVLAREGGQVCYQPSMPPLFTDCNSVVIAWGIGSEVSVTNVISSRNIWYG